MYTRSSQVAFSSLDEILLPYLQHDDVNSKLKMLAKEILLTWVTRHVVYASLEIKRIDKVNRICIVWFQLILISSLDFQDNQ